MAVTRVEATIDKNTAELTESPVSVYSGEIKAPETPGEYGVKISAYDDAGNVGIADSSNTKGMVLEVNKWHTPKTNWKPTDAFNIEDYNRIKGNLEYLHERGNELFRTFQIDDMGADKTSYAQYPYADEINLFESNLDIINQNIFTQNYGTRQYFFDNAPFIKWNELNRIENAILSMRNIMDRLEVGLPKLAIRLGNLKGVKI